MLDITTGIDGWTPARVALLRQLFAEGLTHRAIAEQLGGGLTRNAVIGKAGRMGLVGRERVVREARRFSHSGGDGTVTKIRSAIKTRRLLAGKERAQPINDAGDKSFFNISFADLQDDQCRFPRGEGASITFCGQPRLVGESYCGPCRVLAYYRPTAAGQSFKFKSW